MRNKSQMIRVRIIFCATVLMFFPVSAFASLTQVSLVSQTQTVDGYVYNTPTPATYSKSDVVPITGSCSSSYGTANSSAGDLVVHAWTTGGDNSYWARAQSWYVFYVLGTTLDLTLHAAWGYTGVPGNLAFSYTLKDVETGATISSFTSAKSLISSTTTWDRLEHWSIVRTHRYQLYIMAYADAWDGQSISLTADIVSKPNATCTTQPPMDFNGDCKVDFRDFALFAQGWLQCNIDPPSACW
jgi:hypothetical protein